MVLSELFLSSRPLLYFTFSHEGMSAFEQKAIGFNLT